jgi:hypothetical protein
VTYQFLSIDPDIAMTNQPYVFTNDDPLNAEDALGLIAGPFLDGPSEEEPGSPVGSSVSTVADLEEIEGGGAEKTWGNSKTLAEHYKEHGRDFGAESEEQYAKMANNFLKAAGNREPGIEVKIDKDGIIRVYEPATNTFGSYNRDGTTKTFFKPRDPDYWSTQKYVHKW